MKYKNDHLSLSTFVQTRQIIFLSQYEMQMFERGSLFQSYKIDYCI